MFLCSLHAIKNSTTACPAKAHDMSKSPCVIVEMRLDSWDLGDFCADSPFSLKVAAVLWFSWSGRDETCISSGGSPRSGEARGLDDRQLGCSEGFARKYLCWKSFWTLGRRVSLTWAMAAFGCFWCPCYMLSNAFMCINRAQAPLLQNGGQW